MSLMDGELYAVSHLATAKVILFLICAKDFAENLPFGSEKLWKHPCFASKMARTWGAVPTSSSEVRHYQRSKEGYEQDDYYAESYGDPL